MTGRLDGEVAIVVGAGSSGPGIGIGRAISLLLAREGARLVLVDMHEDRAAETQAEIIAAGGEAIVVAADLADPTCAELVLEHTLAAFGTVGVLVCNAAYTPLLGVLETTPELFERVMAVNVTGPFLLTRAVIPEMTRRGKGSIIYITSVSALRSTRGKQTAYASSKAALLGLMVDVANGHGPDGIRVNCIAPGSIDTPLRKITMAEIGLDPDTYPFGEQTSLGHAGDGWDIAHAALFFASDESRFVTGVHLPVDGGLTTRSPS